MSGQPTPSPVGRAAITAVLVANRGEIAVRVLSTCRRLGIRGVAIFVPADAGAPHVRAADEAVEVRGYLDVDAIVAAALGAGVDAVHPGYGFLSERAAFAEAVAAAGLRLVGPPATVMAQMGRKDAARQIAVAAGVPVVPAYPVDTPAEELALPVLVKAAAGGGGKGMRVVRDPADLPEALVAAGREAGAAFGDATLLLEAYVERGRHIEVQVLADAYGTVLHLHERDCSVQRRHQKVIEEAPAPTLDPATRSAVTTAALDLARAVGYRNAGTVEFLLDSDTGAFYFLEMNTRLQVEHAVTEAICGLDLVELQLRVAAGEPLGIRQDDVTVDGHAIEARVYAEDPYAGFLPQAGTARSVHWPDGAGVRVDQALEAGQAVGTSFDPMLGKIIVHAADRETARRRLVEVLDQTAILGIATNTGLLRAVAAGPVFAAAGIDVAWLDRVPPREPATEEARAVAAWAVAERVAAGSTGPFAADGWRLGGPAERLLVELDRLLWVDPAAGVVDDGDRAWSITPLDRSGDRRWLLVGAQPTQVWVRVDDRGVEVVQHGERFTFAVPDLLVDHDQDAGDGTVVAPMPSVVTEVRVGPGETVRADQVLAVVEAMKMEVALRAPFAGTVASVAASAGDRVRQGERLLRVDRAG